MKAWLERSGLSKEAAVKYSEQFIQDPGMATGALNWYRALPFDLLYGSRLGVVPCPTLYVVGDRDIFVSKKSATLTQDWVSGRYLFKWLDGVTHWVTEERPEALALNMVRFIRSNPVITS
jgi:pimeloyl-ACP methyl ester carboxylesterase